MLVAWLIKTSLMVHPTALGKLEARGRVVSAFWLLSMVLLAAGTWVASIKHLVAKDSLHSWAAFIFAAAIVSCFCCLPKYQERAQELMQVLVIGEFTLFLMVFIGAEIVRMLNGSYGVGYFINTRFSGLAENPNQAALHLLSLPFFILSYSNAALFKHRRWLYRVIFAAVCWIGLSTKSDALVVSWIVASCIGGSIYLTKRRMLAGRGLALYGICFISIVAIWNRVAILNESVNIVSSAVPEWSARHLSRELAHRGLENRIDRYLESSGEKQKIALRWALWKNGLGAIAVSPWVGLGPGAYSGPESPFDGYEAHNSLIDWGTNSGFLGIAFFSGLVFWLAYTAWQDENFAGFTGIVSLLLFAQFHYVFRQPVFWFWLVLLSTRNERTNADGEVEGLPILSKA